MLQSHLIPLLTADVFSRNASDHREAGLALLQELDARGLVDWDAPDETGRPFLHAIVDGGVRIDVLAWVLESTGPARLSQCDAQGRSLLDALYQRADESSLILAFQQATHAQLAQHDQPGDAFGEGWYQRLRRLDRPALLNTLANRGIDPHADPVRLGITLRTLTKATLEVLLRQGLHLDQPVPVSPELERPLWAVAIDRDVDLTAFAQLPGLPDAWESWQTLRQGRPSKGHTYMGKDTVLKAMRELPDRHLVRDDLGRPALWMAAMKNPNILAASTDAHLDVLNSQDHQGRGLWYHLFPLLTRHSDWATKELTGTLPSPVAWDGQPGLFQQWFETPENEFFPLAHPFQNAPSAWTQYPDIPQRWAAQSALWDMSPEAAQRMGETWLRGTHPALVGLAQAYVVYSTTANTTPSYGTPPAAQPGPWWYMATQHEAWPALRAPMAVLLWRQLVTDFKALPSHSVKELNKPLRKAMEDLATLPWQAAPAWFPEAFAHEVAGAPVETQALGQQLAQRLKTVERQVQLQARPAAGIAPRPRYRA